MEGCLRRAGGFYSRGHRRSQFPQSNTFQPELLLKKNPKNTRASVEEDSDVMLFCEQWAEDTLRFFLPVLLMRFLVKFIRPNSSICWFRPTVPLYRALQLPCRNTERLEMRLIGNLRCECQCEWLLEWRPALTWWPLSLGSSSSRDTDMKKKKKQNRTFDGTSLWCSDGFLSRSLSSGWQHRRAAR